MARHNNDIHNKSLFNKQNRSDRYQYKFVEYSVSDDFLPELADKHLYKNKDSEEYKQLNDDAICFIGNIILASEDVKDRHKDIVRLTIQYNQEEVGKIVGINRSSIAKHLLCIQGRLLPKGCLIENSPATKIKQLLYRSKKLRDMILKLIEMEEYEQ